MRRTVIAAAVLAATGIACEDGAPPVAAEQEAPPAKEPRPRAETKPDAAAVVEGNSAFAIDLYRKLRAQDGNLFFSPYSISTALAMTYAGARGATAAEMRKVLHFALPQERLHPAFAKLAAGLKPRGCELHIANRLWGQEGYGFLKSFLKLSEEHYGAGLEQVDFAGATEEARRTINAWVEEKTRNKIKELIPPGTLDALTRLVLTNATYFKGAWASRFDKKRTSDAPFTMSDGRKVRVPTMCQVGEFNYGLLPGLKVLEVPYQGSDASMFVLLPEDADGLPELEESLDGENLKDCLSRVHRREVAVFMPKFKMTSEFRLEHTLSSMGMADAFSFPDADFSAMNGAAHGSIEDLYISAVIHKAFVDVNEKGTEAAAATAVVTEAMEGAGPRYFRADHPFLFLIRDNRSGSILFLGRVVNPLEGS